MRSIIVQSGHQPLKTELNKLCYHHEPNAGLGEEVNLFSMFSSIASSRLLISKLLTDIDFRFSINNETFL